MRLFLGLYMACLPIVTGAQFTNVTVENNMAITSIAAFHGSGISFMDFNNDGRDDITFSCKNAPPKFFRNVGGTFEEILLSFMPLIPNNIDGKMPLWFDMDNDGDKDFLYTSNYHKVLLYRNDGDTIFIDIADAAGINNVQPKRFMGAAAGDYDNDGFLDIFLCKYHNHLFETDIAFQNQCFHNNGDGTFTDVTLSAGLSTVARASFMPVFFDYDRDGLLDIYLVNDKFIYPNDVFHNVGNGMFENVTNTCGLGISIEAMSATVDDYDNDGDLDVYVTNTYAMDALLQNNNGNFSDAAASSGLFIPDSEIVHWGALWLDYDNNSRQDLFIGTIGTTTQAIANKFYINNADGSFTDGSEAAGLDNDIAATYTSAMGDMNGDGYYDFVNSNSFPSTSRLWQNVGGSNHFLSVTLEGTISNRDGVGTYIDLYCEDNHYMRYTMAGENLMSQNSGKEIFGLADYNSIDSLKLNWPSGLCEKYFNLAADVAYHFIEGESFNNIPVALVIPDNLMLCPGDSLSIAAGDFESYLWNTGDTTQSIDVHQAGEYFALVINGAGFPQPTDTVFVSDVINPSVIAIVQQPLCFGDISGSISVSLSEGEIESILWSNNHLGNEINELSEGSYAYNLRVAGGCLLQDTLEIIAPPLLAISTIANPALCAEQPSGSVSPIITGGVPPYFLSTDLAGLDSLMTGNYTITYQDSHECVAQTFFEISSPPAVTIECLTTDVQCFGGNNGSAVLNISGGIPPYNINSVGNFSDALPAGDYHIPVVDANGCINYGNFSILQPEPMLFNLEISDVLCYGDSSGKVVANISGGIPAYTLVWGDLDSLHLAAGSYTVSCTDAHNCTAETIFSINQPEIFAAEVITIPAIENVGSGSATINFYGGSSPFYLNDLLLNANSITLLNQPAGFYQYLISDSNGCTEQLTFDIDLISNVEENENGFQLFPNPAGDELHLLFKSSPSKTKCEIFDNIGQCVANYSISGTNKILDIARLIPGLYLIKINNVTQSFEKR